MTTLPRWRSVMASAAAAAALFTAPLAGATTAYADGHPHNPQPTHAPHHEHGSDKHGSDEHGSDEHSSDENGSDENGSDENGCPEHRCDNDEQRPDKPRLADTGADHTQEVILGSAAAALIAAGAGTMLIARRRSNS